MEIKEIQPINFLFFGEQTVVSELPQYVPLSQNLFKEAVKLGLKITGPIHWHYLGMEDMSKPFRLEVALPVAEVPKEYDGIYHFKRSEKFKCVCTAHEGSWENFTKTYNEVFKFIGQNKLIPSGINREIYVNVDFAHPEANSAQVQVGIK